MGALIFGIVILVLVLVALNAFSKVNPHTAAMVLKATGGTAALGGATFLAARGRFDLAVTLGFVGLVCWAGCRGASGRFWLAHAKEYGSGVAGALRLH